MNKPDHEQTERRSTGLWLPRIGSRDKSSLQLIYVKGSHGKLTTLRDPLGNWWSMDAARNSPITQICGRINHGRSKQALGRESAPEDTRERSSEIKRLTPR